MAADGSSSEIRPQKVPVNAYETTESFVVVAPLPGVMPDDVRVTVDGHTLRIEADMRTEAVKDYVLHEWHYGPYEREIELPDGFRGPAETSFGNGQVAIRVHRG